MPAKLQSIEMQVLPDESPDASWLEQEGLGFEDRLEAYRNDEFHFVGIRAVATIHIPNGSGWIIQTIESPGLWGIESDSGDDYFAEVYEDEKTQLLAMLKEINVSTDSTEAL